MDGLFEMEPRPLAVGDDVLVDFMWGPEQAVYEGSKVVQGFAVCRVLYRGRVVEISPSRVRHVVG